MKRDNDYIRALLQEVEASEDCLVYAFSPEEDSDGPDKRHYHFNLMADAGLVRHTKNGFFRLTNDGHDFLEATRASPVWEKTKATAADVGGMTLRMIFETSVEYLKAEARTRGFPIP